MASSSTPAKLLECSICLDRFTDPRMLPCQHTFCLHCLERLVSSGISIRCPQCRASHPLPRGRVNTLPGNLIINNLLSMPAERPPVPSSKCSDCKEEGPVSMCKHCELSVCVECRVQHTRLSQSLQNTLDLIRDTVKPSTEQLEASLRTVKLERERTKAAVQEQTNAVLYALKYRQSALDATFQSLVSVHETLLRPAQRKPFLENLSRSVTQSTSIQSLQRVEDSLKYEKTVMRLVRRQQALEFVNEPLEVDVEKWGQIRLRDVVLDTGMDKPNWPSLSSGSTSGSVPQYPGGRPRYRNAVDPWNTGAVAKESRNQLANSLSVQVSSPADTTDKSKKSLKSSEEDCFVQACPQPTRPHGNDLPRNVNYLQKERGSAVRDNVKVIGPELRDGSLNLTSPTNSVFNPRTRKLLVCDRDNNRVLSMDLNGSNVGVFYRNRDPYDIAVSDDGQNVYVLVVDPCRIHRVTTHGRCIGSIDTADECYSIVYYNQHVAVLSQKERSVSLHDNISLARVRSFKLNSVQLPNAMAVDYVGNFYITDNRNGAVHVYMWDGGRSLSFGATPGDPVSAGICVDGDGLVCVSRYRQHRIDVYDQRGAWLVHIGAETGCFQNPEGLHLLPDGRMIVADWKNDRLVIL